MIQQETNPSFLSSPFIRKLYQQACQARAFSYSPYSHCQIGASLCFEGNKIFNGCNIENASYGATLCAERVALVKALSENKNLILTHVMVVSDASTPWPPCGLCRQMIAEFYNQKNPLPIYMANLQEDCFMKFFHEIFPSPFSTEYVLKN